MKVNRKFHCDNVRIVEINYDDGETFFIVEVFEKHSDRFQYHSREFTLSNAQAEVKKLTREYVYKYHTLNPDGTWTVK